MYRHQSSKGIKIGFLLAVSGVQEKTIRGINVKLSALSNEEDVALGSVVRLAIGGKLALALCDEQDAGAVDSTKSLLLSLAESRYKHVELAHRGPVDLGLSVLATVVRLSAQHASLGVMRLEAQGGGEEIGRVALGSGAETGVEDVVAAGHTLDDITCEVGVDTIGRDVDTLAGLKNEVVHGNEGHQDTVVSLVVLLGQARNEFRDICVLTESGLVELSQTINDGTDSLLIGLEHSVYGFLEDLVIELAVFWNKLLQGVDLEEGLDTVKRLEATESFEFGQGKSNLGLVVGVCEVLGILLVQLGCKFLVGVQLKRKSFCNGQDLRQEGEVGVAELVDDILSNELLCILVDDVLEVLHC
jgi:hypothetical protein